MTKKTINAQKIDFNALVKIYRGNIEEYFLLGYPLRYNENIILLHYAYDIMLDGYKIIRAKDITDFDNKSEDMKFLNYIYKSESIVPFFPKGFENVENLKDALNVLKEKEIVCVVEREIKEEFFEIGKITNISEDTISLQCFDSKCEVYENKKVINIEDITNISFGGRYSEIMGKYVKW